MELYIDDDINDLNAVINEDLYEQFKTLQKELYSIPIYIKRITIDIFYIYCTIKPELISDSLIKINDNVEFLIIIGKHFPFVPPKVLCLTNFSSPNLNDGRDLLDDIMKFPWSNQFKLQFIITLIPKFIVEFLNQIQNGIYHIWGKFYLDEIYDYDVLKNCKNKFFENAEEIILLNNKKIYEENRLILISDEYFLMFQDMGIFNIGSFKLIFVANIKSLSNIYQNSTTDSIDLKFWVKKDKFCSIKLKTKLGESILKILTENLKNNKIKYKMTNKSLGKKIGKIPNIEINMVEEEINKMEIKNINLENSSPQNIKFLLNLYEKAVQYYSALNNEKYFDYMVKIQKIMGNEKISKTLNEFEDKINEEIIKKNAENNKKENFNNNNANNENNKINENVENNNLKKKNSNENDFEKKNSSDSDTMKISISNTEEEKNFMNQIDELNDILEKAKTEEEITPGKTEEKKEEKQKENKIKEEEKKEDNNNKNEINNNNEHINENEIKKEENNNNNNNINNNTNVTEKKEKEEEKNLSTNNTKETIKISVDKKELNLNLDDDEDDD